MTTDDFDTIVRDWLATRHPKTAEPCVFPT